MRLLVFDVGGTEIKSAIIDENLNFSAYNKIPTPKDSFENFANCIESTYRKYENEVEAVSIALPGFIDVKKGICMGGGPLEYNFGINIKEKLEGLLDCNVHIENDAKAAIIAEHESGTLKGYKNCAVFIIGTGIGGGFIINNELIRGSHSMAGELSFLNIDLNNWDKKESFLEPNCSTSALLEHYRNVSAQNSAINGCEFFERINNDENARNVLKKICRNIAIQIYNIGTMLDIDKIAIGGGISRQEIVLKTIKEEISDLMQNNPLNIGRKLYFPEVDVCKYFNEANLIGAYYSYIKYYEKRD